MAVGSCKSVKYRDFYAPRGWEIRSHFGTRRKMQCVQRTWYWCKKSGCVMFPIDFELGDGSLFRWYMERSDTVRDVMKDITTHTCKDHGPLYIDGERLSEDLVFNEVIMLYICKQMRKAEKLIKDSRALQHKAEDILVDIRSAASATIPRDPSTEPESERIPNEGTRRRSRSPRNRSTVESVSSG